MADDECILDFGWAELEGFLQLELSMIVLPSDHPRTTPSTPTLTRYDSKGRPSAN